MYRFSRLGPCFVEFFSFRVNKFQRWNSRLKKRLFETKTKNIICFKDCVISWHLKKTNIPTQSCFSSTNVRASWGRNRKKKREIKEGIFLPFFCMQQSGERKWQRAITFFFLFTYFFVLVPIFAGVFIGKVWWRKSMTSQKLLLATITTPTTND